jgi:hypothetical protein
MPGDSIKAASGRGGIRAQRDDITASRLQSGAK